MSEFVRYGGKTLFDLICCRTVTYRTRWIGSVQVRLFRLTYVCGVHTFESYRVVSPHNVFGKSRTHVTFVLHRFPQLRCWGLCYQCNCIVTLSSLNHPLHERHTVTQTHRHTDTQTHRHTDTQTHAHTHTRPLVSAPPTYQSQRHGACRQKETL